MSQHKCEYCERQINPCIQPCLDLIKDKTHVCCKCTETSSEHCELPVRIVCDNAVCNLKYQVDWYKIKLEESNNDVAQAKALLNQFRIANIGSLQAKRLIEEGVLDISGIKLFVSKQRLTWDMFANDEDGQKMAYVLMCLHEEFTKQWGMFLNEKAVKVQIKKDLIKSTEAKLKKAQETRDAPQVAAKEKKESVSARMTPFEKIVFHNHQKLGMNMEQAIEFAKRMGAVGEVRPEFKF